MTLYGLILPLHLVVRPVSIIMVILMAVLKKSDIKKLTKEAAEKKVYELETALLELKGEGKAEKRKSLKKAIAKLKTHLTELEKEIKHKAKVKKQ